MNTIYRQAEQSDLLHIMTLLSQERGDDTHIDIHSFLLAINEGDIIGCVRIKTLDMHCLELASLVVIKEYRKLGIGKELVRRVLAAEKRRPIYLLCFKEMDEFYKCNDFKTIDHSSLPKLLEEEYARVKGKLEQSDKQIVAMVRE